MLEAVTILSDVEARHRDILNLEKSISELHSMFMDMAILVDKQVYLKLYIHFKYQIIVLPRTILREI